MDGYGPYAWTVDNAHLTLPATNGADALRHTSRVGVYCPLDQARTVAALPDVAIGDAYTLDDAETALCVRMGRERAWKNKVGKTTDMQYAANRTSDDIHIQGVVGEYALQRMFRLAIDIHDTANRSARNETRFDCVFPNGWTADVKTTYAHVTHIQNKADKVINPSTVLALMLFANVASGVPMASLQRPTLEFHGFVSAGQIYQQRYLVTTSNYSRFYRYPRTALKTFAEVSVDVERELAEDAMHRTR